MELIIIKLYVGNCLGQIYGLLEINSSKCNVPKVKKSRPQRLKQLEVKKPDQTTMK